MKLYEKIVDGVKHCKPLSKIVIIKDGFLREKNLGIKRTNEIYLVYFMPIFHNYVK